MDQEFPFDPGRADIPQTQKEHLAGEAKARGKSFLAEQKAKTVSLLDDIAGALHSSARQLDEKTPTSAHYLDLAANNLERYAGTLRQRDVDSLLNQFGDFARRQPVLVITGTLVAGFLVARVLKSGSQHEKIEEVPGGRIVH